MFLYFRTTGNISTSSFVEACDTDGTVEDDNASLLKDPLESNVNNFTYTPESRKKIEKITLFQKNLLDVISKGPGEFNPDKAFLLSFLPDLKIMNDSQKLELKILIAHGVKHVLTSSLDSSQTLNSNNSNNYTGPNSVN